MFICTPRLMWAVHVPARVVVLLQLIEPSVEWPWTVTALRPPPSPWFIRIVSVANQSKPAPALVAWPGIANVQTGLLLPAHGPLLQVVNALDGSGFAVSVTCEPNG